ncbi:hypothetical protein [Streptosporangium sp. NPDC002524]|uniref:hypothetical protein n=1 Tax=Streptosporangium sp. NPDC002524 TaxID=3154537 RepID=UPI0033213401
MSTILTVLLAVLAWVLASTRPVGSPAAARACTFAEIRAARRRAGWPRVAARTLQISVVVPLLLLATACHILRQTAHAIGTGVALVAVGLAALGSGPELIGGAT